MTAAEISSAVSQAFAWGYGAGLGLVVILLLISKRRGGDS
jgi:hypothetical protein